LQLLYDRNKSLTTPGASLKKDERKYAIPAVWLFPLHLSSSIIRHLLTVDELKNEFDESSYAYATVLQLAQKLYNSNKQRLDGLKRKYNQMRSGINSTSHLENTKNSENSKYNSKHFSCANYKAVDSSYNFFENTSEEEMLNSTTDLNEIDNGASTFVNSAEMDHTVDFLQEIQSTNRCVTVHESSQTDASVQTFINALFWLLETLTDEMCLACVLVLCISDEDKQQFEPHIEKILNYQCKISSLIPVHFRESFTMPTVFIPYTMSESLNFLNLALSNGVSKFCITPIPIQPGDHIYRDIREKGTLKHLTHHGIYLGNGRVINFSGNELSLKKLLFHATQARIRVTSIINFLVKGSRLRIKHYKECDPSSVVISRAEKALVEQTFPQYSMIKNNCEHFCHYCKTGIARSQQVETGLKYASIAASALAAAVSLGVLVASRKR
jgi:hypothetical protein